MKEFTGLEFAPIASIASGFPTDPITGLDSDREHIFPFASRPLGYARNSLSTPVKVDVDLRVLKNTSFELGIQGAPGLSNAIATSTPCIQFSLDYEF